MRYIHSNLRSFVFISYGLATSLLRYPFLSLVLGLEKVLNRCKSFSQFFRFYVDPFEDLDNAMNLHHSPRPQTPFAVYFTKIYY